MPLVVNGVAASLHCLKLALLLHKTVLVKFLLASTVLGNSKLMTVPGNVLEVRCVIM